MGLIEREGFGGLNSDDEDRALPKGDYRYALNIRNGSSDSDNVGAIENVKGNEITFRSLPAGTNKVVGSYDDEVGGSIYYLIQNSNKNDSILRFYIATNTIEEVVTADFSFTGAPIHSIDLVNNNLLYWTDGNSEPKKVNVVKGNDENKNRKINLYFDIESAENWAAGVISYTLSIDDKFNAAVYPITLPNVGIEVTTRDEVAERFAFYINQQADAAYPSGSLTATACGPYIEIEFDFPGESTATFTASDSSAMDVPVNWYNLLTADVVNQIKAPLPCEPTVEYERDPNRETNYLERKLFQFATRLIFDDFEKTVISPISCLAAESACSSELLENNCIKVTFTDPRLNDASALSVIRKVDLLVREGNSGAWKIVETIDQWNFGVGRQYYKFYNEGTYSVLSDEEAFKLYDTVPLKSGAQEFIKNRLHHADVTEGFDPVCVDAEIDVTYDVPPTPLERRTITGKIRINNPQVTLNPGKGGSQQPIWSQVDAASYTSDNAQFGGLNDDTGGVDYFEPNTISQYKQGIPLEGFVVYLAGTNYSAITKQIVPSSIASLLIPGTRNVLEADNDTKRDAIRTEMANIYQEFELVDIPVGKYVLRFASHLLTEVTGNYQKTSTYVYTDLDPTDGIGSKGFTEVEIEVTTTNVIVNGSGQPAFEIGGSWIKDLTNPIGNSGGVKSMAIAGYCTDKDNVPLDTGSHTYEEYLGDTRIDNCDVDLDFIDPFNGNENRQVKADHNGFFFDTDYIQGSVPGASVTVIDALTKSGIFNLFPNLFDDSGTAFVSNTSASTVCIVVRNTDNNVSDFSRTKLQGTVEDSNSNGISNITVVPTFGQPGNTNVNGDYSLIVYANDPNAPTSNDRVVAVLPVLSNSSCVATFAPDRITQTFQIFTGTPPTSYNLANPYPVTPNIVATITFGELVSAFKRGWDGQFGIVYRDIGGRTSVVQTEIKLKKHINFYTETDENDVQENFGLPTLEWEINHLPPSWATHYQWVRTKNEGIGEYLQWAANSVSFESFGTVQHLKIDISNLVDYSERYPNSIIGIDPDNTYRIRFIADENGNFFDSYVDQPILEGTTSSEIIIEKPTSIEITEGTLFEIYRPKLDAELKLYYEMGECHEIINVNHQGPTQNQFQWQFDDNAESAAYAVIVGGATSFPGDLVFTTSQLVNPAFSGIPHSYTVGDKVNIIQDLGATHPTYDGEFTVVEIIDSFSITLNIAFAGATPQESGLSHAPAIGTFLKGDVYYRLRDIPTENGSELVFIDDPNVSDFYVSNDQSIGRLQVEDPTSKETRNENKDVWSGKIFEGTAINNLNQFSGANFESLDKDYGRIYKLQRTENVLLAICQFRTVALYINEAVITTADGSDSITKTDAVIGTVRALRGMYGTVNPESVYLYEGNIYYWDLTTGEVIRYSNNGLQPISDYKMSNHFRNKAKDILDRGITPPNVVGVYDPSFNEYILCFDAYEEVLAETVAFSENLTRWTTFYSYVPEHIQKVGQNLVTFKDGQVWIQNTNTDYNNFNGVQFTSQVRIVSNEAPKNMKVFKTISYESNLPWACPEITIPANAKYNTGMSSRLLAPKFINKEGIFYSEFLKDYNTPGIVVPAEALINGRDLRGKIIEILLETEETDLVVMFSLNVKSVLSEMSNRQLI